MLLDQGRITAQQSFHVSGSFLTAASILPRKASVAQAISALLDRKAIALPQIPRSRRSARMPRSEERGGMAAHSEAEANSLLVYKSPAWKGGGSLLRQSSEDVSRNLGHQGIVEVPSPLGASNSHDRSYFGPQTQHRGPIA